MLLNQNQIKAAEIVVEKAVNKLDSILANVNSVNLTESGFTANLYKAVKSLSFMYAKQGRSFDIIDGSNGSIFDIEIDSIAKIRFFDDKFETSSEEDDFAYSVQPLNNFSHDRVEVKFRYVL